MPAVFLRYCCRAALFFSACAAPVALAACPAGQAEVCVLSCFCAPGTVEEVGPLFEGMSQMAASGLQEWLVRSRDSAAAGDVQPIPLNIRAQLEPYYDLQVLDSARYTIGDEAQLNAANAMLQNPDVNAVTLIDIIVFRHPEDALNDAALWAHELKHVQQYLQWGVGEFAARYSRDYNLVEAPAYAMQRQVAKALRTAANPGVSPP